MEEGKPSEIVDAKLQREYRSGIGKLLHMTRWTRPEIYNSVRELSRYLGKCTKEHLRAMKRAMNYCVKTKDLGITFEPERKWDGTENHEFTITGKSDSEYAKDTSRRSVNGWSVFLEGAPISYKSKMMPVIALSVTEAELFAAVQCAQDMMFAMRVMTSMGLKVKLPMVLQIDNKGAFDLTNNWSVGGRTRHIEVKQYFLRELKESGIIECEWCPGTEMTSDIFTKNLPQEIFEKHASKFVQSERWSEKCEREKRHSQREGRVLEGVCAVMSQTTKDTYEQV